MYKPVTLIVGLGQTVGDAVARRFLEDGHNIVAVDPNADLLKDLKKTLGEKITYHHGPIHSKLGLRNALSAALETYHFVDNVVVIPPLPEPDRLLGLEMEAFENVLMKTVRGAVQALRVFSPELIAERTDPENAIDRSRQTGTFTFVLSLGASMSQPGWFSESVSQHAIMGIIKSAAIELANEGIRVNAVVALRPRAEGREPWLKDRTPMERAALAEEIAETTAFLASPNSAIITGESITLDGGRRWLSGLTERPEED
ncbi:MAG: SDR family NAD(P)-dependent oxidoreductase [Henriciella sp.]|jgi:NAD(P)-dependent dehydrogenase (short-subunit alcohol dehydrogenase family)|nr:SDR family NAD(P)-dependent oxidoreductase [Henriciella sp.]